MPVKLRKMTDGEFETFYRWSVDHQAEEAMNGSVSPEEAIRAARAEIDEMLPDGIRTEGHDLMTIMVNGQPVGYIWTLYEITDGRRQCFVCDFAVWEAQRRKGYGRAALSLAEANALAVGCQDVVLFVRQDNEGAKALYEKCGYRVLRPRDGGQYMIKSPV